MIVYTYYAHYSWSYAKSLSDNTSHLKAPDVSTAYTSAVLTSGDIENKRKNVIKSRLTSGDVENKCKNVIKSRLTSGDKENKCKNVISHDLPVVTKKTNAKMS